MMLSRKIGEKRKKRNTKRKTNEEFKKYQMEERNS